MATYLAGGQLNPADLVHDPTSNSWLPIGQFLSAPPTQFPATTPFNAPMPSALMNPGQPAQLHPLHIQIPIVLGDFALVLEPAFHFPFQHHRHSVVISFHHGVGLGGEDSEGLQHGGWRLESIFKQFSLLGSRTVPTLPETGKTKNRP